MEVADLQRAELGAAQVEQLLAAPDAEDPRGAPPTAVWCSVWNSRCWARCPCVSVRSAARRSVRKSRGDTRPRLPATSRAAAARGESPRAPGELGERVRGVVEHPAEDLAARDAEHAIEPVLLIGQPEQVDPLLVRQPVRLGATRGLRVLRRGGAGGAEREQRREGRADDRTRRPRERGRAAEPGGDIAPQRIGGVVRHRGYGDGVEQVAERPNVELRGDGAGGRIVVLAFPYDHAIVAAVRGIPHRRFDWDTREWWAPVDDWVAVHVADVLARFPELTPSDEVAAWLARDRRALGRPRLDDAPRRARLVGADDARRRGARGAAGGDRWSVDGPHAGAAHARTAAAALRELRSARFDAGAERCLTAIETGDSRAARAARR